MISKEGITMTNRKFSRKRIGQALGLLVLSLALLAGSGGYGQQTFDPKDPTIWIIIFAIQLPPGSGPKGVSFVDTDPGFGAGTHFLAIANGGSNTVALGDLEQAQNQRFAYVPVGLGPGPIEGAAFNAAPSVANSGSKEGQPSQIRTAQAQQQVLRAFTANFGSNDVSVVDLREKKVVETIKVGRQPTSLHFDPNSNKLYVNNFGDSSVSVIEVKATGGSQIIATIRGFREPIFVRISPDGKRGYVSSQRRGEGVAVFDTATNTVTGRIALPNVDLRRLALSPDSKRLYVAVRTDGLGTGQIAVIDTESLQVLQRYRTESFPLEIAVTPNGKCLVITHSIPNKVSLMAVSDGQFAVGQDPTAQEPQSVAIIEDRAYVTNRLSDTISAFKFGGPCAEKK
jgi:YVTN family beta-propeller protein